MAKRKHVQNRGGVRLRDLLDASGEKQWELEERLDLVRGYVSDAIKGRARPSFAKRMRFHAELKIPLDLWDVDIVTKKETAS